jgi:hypothetical protein
MFGEKRARVDGDRAREELLILHKNGYRNFHRSHVETILVATAFKIETESKFLTSSAGYIRVANIVLKCSRCNDCRNERLVSNYSL